MQPPSDYPIKDTWVDLPSRVSNDAAAQKITSQGLGYFDERFTKLTLAAEKLRNTSKA